MRADLHYLIPEAVAPYMAAKGRCHQRGIKIVETCVKRSLLEQVALFAQGRQRYAEVCALRSVAGLHVISEEAASHKVTWRFMSSHIPEFCDADGKSRAVDFALVHNVRGVDRLHWNLKLDVNKDDVPDYIEAAKIFEDLGFKSGRKYGDYCHIEWPKK